VFSFLFVCSQVRAADPTITLESNPQASNGTVTINLGDTITFTGFPNNLTGDITTDYTRSFNFDPIFDGVCNQNGSNGWSQKCTPTQTGTGTFSIQITQNGQTYNSNVIKVNVVYVNPGTPSITVLAPNGGETYQEGDIVRLKWNSSNLPTDYRINLAFNYLDELKDEYKQSVLITKAQDKGYYDYKLPLFSQYKKSNYPLPGKNYEFTAYLFDVSLFNLSSSNAVAIGSSAHGDNNNFFTINRATLTTPSITVLTPNGRDMYEVGQQINVTWDSTGISENSKNIDITLHGYNSNGVIVWSKELSSFTLNDGQEKVILPTYLGGLPFGKNFVISVGTDSTNNPSPIFDYSDSTFTIGKATDVTNGGCSNGEIYSSTSGQVCPKILDANDGCYGARYSATTGKACPLSMVTEEGCKNGAIYSYTTGAKCSMINTPICPANMPNPLALCSDGKIEAATKDANNCTTSFKCTNPRNDLGCKNNEIYSTVTNQACPLISLDNGCTGTNKYSSTTGAACSGKISEVDDGCNGLNKYSIITGQVCSNVTMNTNSTVTSTKITRTLKVGMIGDDIKVVQKMLGVPADGIYGNWTALHVKNWQVANGLTSDGAFGPMSRQKAGLAQ